MTIEVLVGMIASGKSTYARKRASEGALVVCHDDLCAMLHAGALGGCGYEPELRDMYRHTEEDVLKRIIEVGRDVVIDRTHLTRESRGRWVKFCRWPHVVLAPPIIAVVFPAAPAPIHAVRRFEADPRGRTYEDWLKVALHHAEQMEAEPISESEGFHEVRYAGGLRG